MATKKVICLGDTGSHSASPTGIVLTSGQTGVVMAGSIPIACAGATYQCSDPIHEGATVVSPITPNTVKTFVEGKLVVCEGAVAGCGAILIGVERLVHAE